MRGSPIVLAPPLYRSRPILHTADLLRRSRRRAAPPRRGTSPRRLGAPLPWMLCSHRLTPARSLAILALLEAEEVGMRDNHTPQIPAVSPDTPSPGHLCAH